MRCTALASLATALAFCAGVGCSIDFDRYVGGGPLDLGPPRDASNDLAAIDAGATDDAESLDAAEGDASIDAAEDALVTDAGCVPVRPPGRATASDTTELPPRFYAFRRLGVGGDGAWRRLGYDLDGLCTDVDSDPSALGCAPPAGFSPVADAPGGLDNAFGQAFMPLLVLIYPMFEDALNAAFEAGEVGVLIRLAGWNGTPYDPVVDVALVEGVEVAQAGDAGRTLPRWDGNDDWIVADRAFAAGDLSRPLARDANAYVVGGLLVAHPRDGTEVHLPAGLGQDLAIRLDGMSLTAQLTVFGDALEMGIVSGNWPLDDIYAALPGLGLCPDTDAHERTAAALQRSADVRGAGDVSPMLPCDSLSVGFGFEATSVNVIALGEGNTRADTCTRRDAGPEAGP